MAQLKKQIDSSSKLPQTNYGKVYNQNVWLIFCFRKNNFLLHIHQIVAFQALPLLKLSFLIG